MRDHRFGMPSPGAPYGALFVREGEGRTYNLWYPTEAARERGIERNEDQVIARCAPGDEEGK